MNICALTNICTCALHIMHAAQLIAESPVTATVALGMNATFSCRGDNNITWEVNGLQIRGHTQVDDRRAHKVYVPLPKPNFSELIITATNITNYTSVICIVGPSNSIGDNAVKTNEARLLVYGEFNKINSKGLIIIL